MPAAGLFALGLMTLSFFAFVFTLVISFWIKGYSFWISAAGSTFRNLTLTVMMFSVGVFLVCLPIFLMACFALINQQYK